MGQHICFGATCDIVANSDYTDYKNTLHGNNMSYRTYRLCPFKTFEPFINFYMYILLFMQF